VDPAELPGDPEPGLVGVGDRRGGEPVTQRAQERLGVVGGLTGPGVQAARGDGGAEQVGHGLRGPLVGQQLTGGQIDAGRTDPRPVLRGRVHPFRGGGHGGGPARAEPVFDAVFGDFDEFGGQVEDLPGLDRDDLGAGRGCAAAGARFRPVGQRAVGVVDPGQGGPVLAGLFPGLAARPGPQGFRRGFGVPLRGRRGVGVPRVGTQAFFQLGDALGEAGDLREQLCDGLVFPGDDRVFLRDDPPVLVRG
jgi:hypothetical protein